LKVYVPSQIFSARNEQRTLIDRGFGLRSCRSGDFYYVEVDLGRLGAAFAQLANPMEEYR